MINVKYIYILLFLCVSDVFFVCGQTSVQEMFKTPAKTGGVYYAYPVDSSNVATKVPSGYKPFYISHYGRHGSRYLLSDEDYKNVIDLFDEACRCGVLSPLGIDVYNRLRKIWTEAEGRGGDLSPLGVRQLRGIAERMYNAYPEVFVNGSKISARSTIVIRCILSMNAFCERLKELNPSLQTKQEATHKYMSYLNYHSDASQNFTSAKGPWKEEFRKFEVNHTHPDRLIHALFSDSLFIVRKVNPYEVMWSLYWIASDMQNMETPVSFYDIFQKDELFDLWQCINYKFYVCDANSIQNDGLMVDNAKPLLKNIIESAHEVISSKRTGATLRFGHDGNIIPLAALLHLDSCYASIYSPSDVYKVWSDFKIAPMAGNLQIVFFRNEMNNIIVKFLLNEQIKTIPLLKSNILPYYRWSDVEEYFNFLLEGERDKSRNTN